MIIDIYIGNDKIEIFKDEGVQLNSSVANINDITKNTTDYTQNFTIPASDRNNAIFKHYYDADIDNGFDARVKVNGRIDIDGIPFKYGKWKLLKVNVKQNKPSNYSINFTGNLFSLKEKFKEDELTDLDLSAFDHAYNSTNVRNGLIGSLFSGNLIYNLFAKKQYYYNNISSDNVNTPTIANIAWGGGANVGVLWSDLKPSLRLIKIIEAIEAKYNITFTRDFFGRVEFTDLFMWLNADGSILGTPTEQLINFEDSIIPQDDYGFNFATETWVNTVTTFTQYKYRIIVTPAVSTVPYKIIVKNFGVPVAEFSSEGGTLDTTVITIPLVGGVNTPFQYQFFLSSSNSLAYTAEMRLRQETPVAGNTSIFDSASMSLIDTFNVSANVPKMKIIDFVKGLFSMFKLVVIADQNDNIYVNTLNDYYASGQLYDLTKYTDFSSYDVERGTLLNQINFNFQEPTTLLNEQFKLNTGIAYGDEELTLTDENGEVLDGESFEVELPFEQVVYERLPDLNDNQLTNIVYGGIFDASIDPVNPEGHLFYNRNIALGTKPLAFINDAGTKVQLTSINIPSHTLGVDNPQFSTIFSSEFSEWNGLLITNTLYTNYYKNYIDSIFNVKRRNFMFTCKNIPLRILTSLELNDVIKIKENYYRIDNYSFNLLTGETTFKLINSFDNTINGFNVDRRALFVDFQEQTQSVYVTNLDNFGYSSSELWVTASNTGNIVYILIEANDTGLTRTATLTIQNTATLQEVDVFISQQPNDITFDTTAITFDTTLITWDNG
jgi:hypothetical protein